MHSDRPSVSVVIPCYNAEKWIARCIQSVIDQHNVNVEIIVVDDGSTDKSLDVIKSFGHLVRWKTDSNEGACRARNCGLELARGEFIIFLDADDYIEPDSVAEWVESGTNADLVFGPFAYEDAGSRYFGKPLSPSMNSYSMVRQWLQGQFIPPCSVLWRRSFLSAIGGWDPRALRNQDGEVTLRGLLKGARVGVAQRGLGVYVGHPHAGRVSKRTGREVLLSQLSSFENLWALAQQEGQNETQKDFARSFYLIAYEAFASGIDDIGYVALSRARQMGLKGHLGTLAHRTLSSLLGLRNKLRVTGIVKGRRVTRSSNQNANQPLK
jgi:Glycosyl transferase family 2